MAKDIRRRKIKGVEFVVDENGEKTAVLIDLCRHRDLWEDFYDTALANARKDEPHESLETVKRKVFGRT
jgi:hypothetical protein